MVIALVVLAIIAIAAYVLFSRSRKTSGGSPETKPSGTVTGTESPGNETEQKPLLISIKEAFRALADPPFERELSYEEAMKYFIEHKNDKSAIAKGAMLKEDIQGGFVITQIFLDTNNKVVEDSSGRPLGCKRKVSRLDTELLDLFKNDSLVIVE